MLTAEWNNALGAVQRQIYADCPRSTSYRVPANSPATAMDGGFIGGLSEISFAKNAENRPLFNHFWLPATRSMPDKRLFYNNIYQKTLGDLAAGRG